jgi:hypothetical protein
MTSLRLVTPAFAREQVLRRVPLHGAATVLELGWALPWLCPRAIRRALRRLHRAGEVIKEVPVDGPFRWSRRLQEEAEQ